MTWYYAENGQQKGPLSDWDFANAARNGSILPNTLIWHDGLPEWAPLGKIRPDLASAPNAATIGGFAVPEHQKELLVQQMREGVLPADVSSALQSGGPAYVGFWWRVLARFIDGLVSLAINLPMMLALGSAAGRNLFVPHTDPAMDWVNWTAQVISILIGCIYYTWMTGRFGATVGKLALGFKVVRADGAKVSYGRALARWAAAEILNNLIWVFVILGFFLVTLAIGGGFSAVDQNPDSSSTAIFGHLAPGLILAMVLAVLAGLLVGAFPWWMAAFDSQKRALHDRICATRVIRTGY